MADKNSTKRHIHAGDEVTTFTVSCADVTIAQSVLTELAKFNMVKPDQVETFVYRSEYDANKEAIKRQRAKLLGEIGKLQLGGAKREVIDQKQAEYKKFCDANKLPYTW